MLSIEKGCENIGISDVGISLCHQYYNQLHVDTVPVEGNTPRSGHFVPV